MAWIESHQTLKDHPKLYVFMDTLKISKPQAVGHLHLFWWWCVDYAPTGVLKSFSDIQIGRASCWENDPKLFVTALCTAGFLDRRDGVLTVHDWLDFCGALMDRRISRLAAKRPQVAAKRPPTQPNQPDHTQPTKHLTASKSRFEPQGEPKAGKEPAGDYQRLVKHVCESYKAVHRVNYPFGGEDGRVVKWCLQSWTVFECMALWDQFISRRWDFEKDGKIIKVPHALRNFQTKVRVLLEETGWKAVAKKYGEVGEPKTESLLTGIDLKSVPPPATNKITLDQARKLQEISK